MHLPVAGDDLAAVRTVATTLDGLAPDGLPQLVAAAGILGAGSFMPVGGRVDLTGRRWCCSPGPLRSREPGRVGSGETLRAIYATDPADENLGGSVLSDLIAWPYDRKEIR
jgi:hypothetical protein